MSSVQAVSSDSKRRMLCPYGWKCPVDLIMRRYRCSGRSSEAPLFTLNRRYVCKICKGLLKGEFQAFITIRPAPYCLDRSTALETLAKLAEKLALEADILDLKAVIVIAVGKVIKSNGRYFERGEIPHIHVLVGAKKRLGRFRVPRDVRIKKLREFVRMVELFYTEVYGGVYPKSIHVRYIKYDDEARHRKRGRGRRSRRNKRHGKGKFRLRAYLFKQLVPRCCKPIIVNIHARRKSVERHHETPSTDNTKQYSSIRAYDNAFEVMAGGMGGYGGLAARHNEDVGDRRTMFNILNRLRVTLSQKSVFMDLHIGYSGLRSLLIRFLRKLSFAVINGSMSYREATIHLKTLYDLALIWNEMVESRRFDDLRDWSVMEIARNYGIRLQNLIYLLLSLERVSREDVIKVLRSIIKSMRETLRYALESSSLSLDVDAATILNLYVRFQILSKKKIRKLIRDLEYTEKTIDKDLGNVAASIVNIGFTISNYIEDRWKRASNILWNSDTRVRGRYGEKGSEKLEFVMAVKNLIRQVKGLKKIFDNIESLENIIYLDSDEFRFEAREMLRDSSPCFLFANHVVCVDLSDAETAMLDAKEVIEYAIAYCRYCLGIRVKSPIEPCYEGDKECWKRFCSLGSELLELVNAYRELLKKVRTRLGARAKMRKRRYRQRLRKLIYKLSKHKSLDEFMGKPVLDPFKRAINVLNTWLRKRGHQQLHSFNYSALSKTWSISDVSAELSEKN